MSATQLQEFELFRTLTEDDITKNIRYTGQVYEEGEVIFEEGQDARFFFIIATGAAALSRIVSGKKIELALHESPNSMGEVPLLRGEKHLATAIAKGKTEVFKMTASDFWHMIGNCPEVREKILKQMLDRNMELDSMTKHTEKLVAIGTLSAGLMHEMFNPGSAAQTAAKSISEGFVKLKEQTLNLLTFACPDYTDVSAKIMAITSIDQNNKPDGRKLGQLQDELTAWLEENNIEDTWKLAPTLANANVSTEKLEEIKAVTPEGRLSDLIHWTDTLLEISDSAHTITISTGRMNELVKSFKNYAFTAQDGNLAQIKVNDNLKDILVLLKTQEKVRNKNVKVNLDLQADLPVFCGNGSQLNSVWMNLLDNAVDALPEQGGMLNVKTYLDTKDSNMISIEVQDNGHGIPDDVMPHLFEPFYTTKPQGQGLGLGLDMVRRLVEEKHGGSIRATCKEGVTTFKVCLPIIQTIPEQAN